MALWKGIVISASHATRVQAALVMELPPPPAQPELGVHTLDPVSPAVTSTISSEEMGAIPLTTRNWQAFAAITPGGNPIPHGGASGQLPGQRGDGSDDEDAEAVGDSLSAGALLVSSSIDGIPSTPGFRTPGQRQSLESPSVGESAVQSVAARTGEAPAQQNASTGASIDVTTVHGQNGFHGQAFYLNRQNLFNAKNPFTQILAETSEANGIYTANLCHRAVHAAQFAAGVRIWYWKPDQARQAVLVSLLWTGCSGTIPRLLRCAILTISSRSRASPDLQMLAVRIGPAYLQSGPACPAGSLSAAAVEEQAAACYSGLLEQMAGMLGPVPRNVV